MLARRWPAAFGQQHSAWRWSHFHLFHQGQIDTSTREAFCPRTKGNRQGRTKQNGEYIRRCNTTSNGWWVLRWTPYPRNYWNLQIKSSKSNWAYYKFSPFHLPTSTHMSSSDMYHAALKRCLAPGPAGICNWNDSITCRWPSEKRLGSRQFSSVHFLRKEELSGVVSNRRGGVNRYKWYKI